MNIKNLLIAISCIFLLASCDLDKEPGGVIPSDKFFQNDQDAQRALMGCYASLDYSVYDAYYDGYADNNFCQYPWESNAPTVSSGNINTDTNFGYSYRGIRRCNLFLDKIGNAKMDEQLKNQFIAEVKVLRAVIYYNKALIFGALPLIDKYIETREEGAIAPVSEDEILAFCVKELKESVKDLPQTPEVKSRIGKAAALTFLARVELQRKNWQGVVDATKQIMGMGYSLFKTTSVPSAILKDNYEDFIDFKGDAEKETFCQGLYSYQSLFYDANKENSEVILNQEHIADNYNYISLYLLADNYGGGWSSITPTVELVNAYWTKEGKKFTPPTREERAAAYNKGKYTDKYLSEFKNRDTRLYATILFPGILWNELSANKFEWTKVGANISKTGYNYRKMIDPENDIWHKENDYPLIRYAEVLLMFAEAQNELSGPNEDVYKAINDIRARVSMPAVDRAENASKESMRELIRNERRIELANEGFRWNDVRRWGISAQVMKTTYAIDGSLTQERRWDDKFIRLPYPQTAIDRNPNLADAQAKKGY